MGIEVFGREQEGATVAAFVAAASSGPAVLEIIGEAGIGKTTLWLAALEHASSRGMAVASARAAEAESHLSFSALTDLLEPYIPLVDALPHPQRRALSVALLHAEPGDAPVDHRAVATAALGVVRAIAAERPLLIGIDDLQWADLPTLRVLEFVMRRLRAEPVRLVAARWGAAVGAFAPSRWPPAPADPVAIQVGALGADALHQLILSRLGVPLTRPALLHLHRATGGNPFYSLQIVQHALQQDLASLTSFEQLPVPPSLHSLISARLTGVGPEARQLLLVVSALSRPTMRLLERVYPGGSAAGLLASLERDGIVTADESGIRFAHPLIASTVYADAPAEERRKVHRMLASHVETPEERARHLALGVVEPDEEIAAVLESAATHARARGAPDAAAELLDLACRLTPLQQASSAAKLPGRRIALAVSLLDAGDTRGAGTLIRGLLPELQPGRERADAHELHARILAADERWADAYMAFAEAAGDAGDDVARRARLEAALAYASLFTGSLREARRHGRAALALAETLAQPEVLAETLQALGFVEFQLRGGVPWDLMRRALAEEERGSWASAPMLVRPRFALAQMLMAVDELDRARELFVALLRAADETGDATAPATFLAYLSQIECFAGNWQEASRYAREARSWALQTGMRTTVISAQLLVDAHSGDLGAARRGADEAMELVRTSGALWTAIPILGARGLAELSAGDLDAAARSLDEATSLVSAQGIAEPGYGRIEPLAIEVDIRRGRLDEAERRVDAFESAGRRLERPWVLASASHARGLLAAARGDLDLAREAELQALVGMEDLGRPFEVARIHLALGVIERRRRKKRLAREHLELATAGFDRLGARLWAEQAGEELSRTGYRSPERGLSPTERRVAELVAEGLSNREIARTLFVTVNTVESTLRHAFLKLGIHSRVELARHLDR
jgi:DNA-binding CsgD family transcriptional regulator